MTKGDERSEEKRVGCPVVVVMIIVVVVVVVVVQGRIDVSLLSRKYREYWTRLTYIYIYIHTSTRRIISTNNSRVGKRSVGRSVGRLRALRYRTTKLKVVHYIPG